MDTLTSIVAINPENVIGAGNRLPWRVRSDLKFFREQTEHQVVIMGRKTFDSLGQKGLPNRKNVVVTHGFGLHAAADGCKVAHGIEEALALAEDWRTKRQQVFVVGGASMYDQFAPYVDRYLITLIHKQVSVADTFFDYASLADECEWSMTQVGGGKADGIHDEADFQIFAFSRNHADHTSARSEAISRYCRRAKHNLLSGDRLLRVAG